MTIYEQTNITRVDWARQDEDEDEGSQSHPPSSQLSTLLDRNSYDTRVLLNSGLSTPELYRMTFRLVKCKGLFHPIELYFPPNETLTPPNLPNGSVPSWPSVLAPNILRGWWKRYQDYKYSSSCCSNTNSPDDPRHEMSHIRPDEEAFKYDDEIYAFIYDYTHAMLDTARIKNSLIYIVNARIIWAVPAPNSAILSEQHKFRVAHGPAVTQEHLALVRARGHIDHIHVDFQCDIITPSILGKLKRGIGKISSKVLN
ncbi:hypothetical protein F4803DRAFT_557364 [Xylaria telfairii]|nr:hypothetical protein F4803DRAFT_557364 [Xylaria telfairii]